MKIKKKLLVFLVAFATALNLMPTIYATSLKNNVGHVAEINREGVTYSFDTLDEAVQKAKDSETITVLKDCTTEAGFNMSKNLKVKGKNGVKPTITFTKYGIALWAKSLTFEDLNIVMNGIGSTPYYQEWGWMTICGQSNSKLNLVNTNMKMDGQKLNKHAIYADNGLKLYMKDSNLVIKNYGQDALEWNGGSFDYNIEMIDSTYLSDCNRSGFTGTFKVKATRSNIDVLNSHGNGSNGSNFYFYDSHVNFSDNKSHGLSATVLESTNTPITAKRNGLYGIVARYVEFDNCKGDSRILAEGNKWNGIRIGLDSSSKHKFVVKNSDINVIDNGYKKDTDTWSGLVLRHVPAASMDKKSTLTVTGNANNGIRMYANSHFTIEEGTPVIIMNNNSTLKGGNGEGGGVRIVENSSLVLPSHAKLYNNHADKAGDDIFLQDGSEITFGDTGNDWVLDGTPNTKDCLKAIDGWYDDRANTDTEFNRWDAHSIEEFHVRKMNSGTYNKAIALKAAHNILTEDVYETANVPFVKLDSVTKVELQGAEFTLYKDSTCKDIVGVVTSNENGEFDFSKLPIGTYFMKETKSPAGYALLTEGLNIKVYEDTEALTEQKVVKSGEVVNVVNHKVKTEFDGNENYFKTNENGVITVLNNATVNLEFNKVWKDNENTNKHPTEISAVVKADGKDYKQVKLQESNDWKLTLTDLPKYNEEGKIIVYTIEEITKVDHYVASYSEDGLTITNTYVKSSDDESKDVSTGDSSNITGYAIAAGVTLILAAVLVGIKKHKKNI